MYNYFERTCELYNLLEDNQSREIFWARLKCDIEPSLTNTISLVKSGQIAAGTGRSLLSEWRDTIKALNQKDEKIVIYGAANAGRAAAKSILLDGLDFYCFISRGAERYPEGILGKPVYDPEWLFSHKTCNVIIASDGDSKRQISKNLKEHNYPVDHVLSCFDMSLCIPDTLQYFLFPHLIKDGAFIDGGCFDGQNSIDFTKIKGNQSAIYAFEPDAAKLSTCEENLKNASITNFTLIEAGLSDFGKTVDFIENSSGGSYVLSEWNIDAGKKKTRKIKTVAIDDVIGDQRVGMIKMDIEGSELSALHGAEKTIIRDKPFLAICVYHKPGDVLAVMDFCQRIVPAYHFVLRHHSEVQYETVMYASTEPFAVQ